MKKLGTLFLGVLLLVPSLGFAQTATTSLTYDQRQSLIQLLLQEVQLLEQQIAQIIAQQQQQAQTLSTIQAQTQGTGSGAINVQIPTPPVSQDVVPTPSQYPTPEVVNVVNDNATFSATDAANGFTIGTFSVESSGPWRANFIVNPTGIGTPITQTQANNGNNCIGYVCSFSGNDVEDMMVGLDVLPPPGTYSLTEKVYIDSQLVSGSPMSFTFQVQ